MRLGDAVDLLTTGRRAVVRDILGEGGEGGVFPTDRSAPVCENDNIGIAGGSIGNVLGTGRFMARELVAGHARPVRDPAAAWRRSTCRLIRSRERR